MLKRSLCLFLTLGLLAIGSALDATLTKSFYFVNNQNDLGYEMIQTNNGPIAYSVSILNSKTVSHFTLLGPDFDNVTVILSDLTASCGQGPTFHSRLHYHVATSNLVYYCTNNNSLLILNERDFSVRDMFSTNLTTNFSEVKLVSDGDYVAVLGMDTVFATNPNPSQLIRINLHTWMEKSVTFDHNLSQWEAVINYVSTGKGQYILTNRLEANINIVTLYSLKLISSSYQLTPLATFKYSLNVVPAANELYSIGTEYLATNDDKQLLIFNTKGVLVKNMTYLQSKQVIYDSSPVLKVKRVGLIGGSGNSEIYALLNYQVIKISIKATLLFTKIIISAFDMQIALANQNGPDTLFYSTLQPMTFNVMNLERLETRYSSVGAYQNLMTTNTTYCIVSDQEVLIFDIETDQLLENVAVGYSYYYDQIDEAFFFLSQSTSTTCQLIHVNLQTGETNVTLTFEEDCSKAQIIHLNVNQEEYPEFLISLGYETGLYSIVSQTYGVVEFTVPDDQDSYHQKLVIPNYKNMSFYYLQQENATGVTNVSYYALNTTTKQFSMKYSYYVKDVPVGHYYSLGSRQAAVLSNTQLTIIDLVYGPVQTYNLPSAWIDFSTFQDKSNANHFILDNVRDWSGSSAIPVLVGSEGVTQLPGTTNYTIDARGGGPCKYYVVDGFSGSVGLVKFYDVCSSAKIAKIDI